jgi:hypothetical protein
VEFKDKDRAADAPLGGADHPAGQETSAAGASGV